MIIYLKRIIFALTIAVLGVYTEANASVKHLDNATGEPSINTVLDTKIVRGFCFHLPYNSVKLTEGDVAEVGEVLGRFALENVPRTYSPKNLVGISVSATNESSSLVCFYYEIG